MFRCGNHRIHSQYPLNTIGTLRRKHIRRSKVAACLMSASAFIRPAAFNNGIISVSRPALRRNLSRIQSVLFLLALTREKGLGLGTPLILSDGIATLSARQCVCVCVCETCLFCERMCVWMCFLLVFFCACVCPHMRARPLCERAFLWICRQGVGGVGWGGSGDGIHCRCRPSF